ncbi:MAG: glycosyltransferase [Giesbergeria sp.]
MGDLVSCVCVTRGLPDHVRNTIRCFQSQTYQEKELVVVCRGIGAEAKKEFERAGAQVFEMPGVQLGVLRNKSVELARGKYVCNWDDDDWSSPDRIEVQLAALLEKKAQACVLRRYVLWDERAGKFYESYPRATGWESSLLAERAAVLRLRYPPVNLGEDRQLMSRMATAYRVHVLDALGKYVYRFHGLNACSEEHFRRLFAGSSLLTTEEQVAWQSKMGS